ncbi:MAG: hypothetical protein U1F56_00035 [Rubrivivax sp.]
MIVLLLVLLAWWDGRGADPPAEPASPGAADALATQALRALGEGPAGTDAASAPVSAQAASRPASTADADTDPTCPASWKALAGLSGDVIDRAFRRARPAALQRAAALLAASPDPFERLMGQLLAERAQRPDEAPSPEAFLALVSEALAGRDARITGLAAQLCANPSVEAPAACSSLTPQQWASVDPDNVQPWLAMAVQAQDSGDTATVREAMARAAQAHRNRLASTDLVQLARSPALQALSPTDRQVLVIDLMGVGVALTAAGSIDVSRLCPSGMGPGREAQCSAVAGLLVEQGENLLQRGVGIAIGRRAGWDAEQAAALGEENKAMMEALSAVTLFGDLGGPPMTQAQACEAYRRVEAVTRLMASDNEAALARRALQQARAASAAAGTH